jgi:DNA-binding transcriptional LysR family regulator
MAQPLALTDWSLVRTFLAVIDAGSVTGAARVLGAHQPTVSRQIAELERQLGCALFERTGRGATPTRAALALVDGARQMQAGAASVSAALASGRAVSGGTVRLSAPSLVAAWLLPPLLAELSVREPDIAVELVASNQISNLLRREADIAVRMVRVEQSSLVARKITDVRVVAAAHQRYLARAGTPRSADELLTHRLIGADRDSYLIRGFAKMGFRVEPRHFALRTDDPIVYAQLVASGAGIGFLGEYVVDRNPGLVTVLPELEIPRLPCWLAVHREIRGNPAIRRVYDFLASGLRDALG